MNQVIRVSLTVALAVVGLIAFCLIIITLVTITWWAPIG